MLTIQIAVIAAALIIAGLVGYAVKLLLQLKQQQTVQQQQEKQTQIQREQKNRHLADSIDTIAKAMQQGQCDYSEGTIRICVLLDHLQLEPATDFKTTFPALHQFYIQIKDMATHKARAALPKNERMRQDMQRVTWETEAKPNIETELPKLRDNLAGLLAMH